MIEITVSPLQFVPTLLIQQNPDLVISVLGASDALGRSGQPKVPPWPTVPCTIPNLRLEFDDVGFDQKRGGVLSTHFHAPTVDHLVTLRDCVRDTQFSKAIIHCRAGSSRSPAVATIVAALLGATPQQLRELLSIKNYFRPSLAVLTLWDTMQCTPPLLPLAQEGKSWARADEWGPATFRMEKTSCS